MQINYQRVNGETGTMTVENGNMGLNIITPVSKDVIPGTLVSDGSELAELVLLSAESQILS